MKITYYLGRTLQLFALLLMPFAIWVGHFGHNEQGAIIIFVGSIAIFFIGWLFQGFIE
ncbi:MAG: hypothetical protein HY351_05340 [Candidatus Omnitrophica bacterium]|nr:hypothetical protein [Candidatus Omnitrophota bacterium]